MPDPVSVHHAPVDAPAEAHAPVKRAGEDLHNHTGVAEITKEAIMKWIHDGHPDNQHDVRNFLDLV